MSVDAPKWSLVLEFAIVRLLYFLGSGVGIVVCTLVGDLRHPRLYSSRSSLGGLLLLSKTYWTTVLIASILIAVFGPGIYQRYVMRGRGSLRDIKENSRHDGDPDLD